MLQPERVAFLLADARGLYDDALEMLEQDRLRNAADKAWCATKRATDALILARTGDEPRTSEETTRMIRQLRVQDPSLEPLRVGYGSRHALLLDTALYDGILEPAEDIIRDVHTTIDFIQDAEQAAAS